MTLSCRSVVALASLGVLFAPAPSAQGQQVASADDVLEARIWLDRGSEPVLRRGDRVRVYYRTSHDADVAVFHIDTDGVIRLLRPRGDESTFVHGGRDYRLLLPQSSYWFVDEDEGEGYFFMVASPYPLDFSSFRWVASEGAWDLASVGRSVYEDPFTAIDDYVMRLLPEWETTPYALDFLSYDVGAAHDYPRFLCYQCHGFRTYAAWNPYTYACTDFRVVIWDDPYFMPAYRYGPTRVVYTRPPPARARFAFKERAAGEAWSPLTRARPAPDGATLRYLEPSAADSPSRGLRPTPRRTVQAPESRPAAERGRGDEGAVRPPSGEGGGVRPPSGSVRPPLRRGGADAAQARPTLQRRPPVRQGMVRPTRRPTPEPEVRRVPGGGAATPLVRPGRRAGASDRAGTAGSVRPPSRPSAGARGVTPPRTSRPTAGTPQRGSAVTRPPTRGSSGSARPSRPTVRAKPATPPRSSVRPPPARRPPAKAKRPPPRKKKPGGG